MYKFIALFIFATLSFSNTIKFEEEKFVNSLQSSIFKNGTIDINNDFVKVSYLNSSKSYLFYDDYFILKDSNSEEKLSYEDKIELNLFAKLINLIYKDEKDEISNFFNIQEDKDATTLTPNEYLSNSISKIEFKKESDILIFLKIYFKNEDWIKIVQN